MAAALQLSIRLLRRQLRQSQVDSDDDLTLPETSALALLDRSGPTTPGALAKVEQISPQSMGATLGALETRGLVDRQADPADGRRVLMSITEAGTAALRSPAHGAHRTVGAGPVGRVHQLELRQLMTAAPLIERLAHNL